MNTRFIFIAFSLCLVQSCQKAGLESVTVAQVVDRLQENANQPYGCEMKGANRIFLGGSADMSVSYYEVEFLHDSKWVSSALSSVWHDDYFRGVFFEKRVNFLSHSIEEDRYGEVPEWACTAFRKSSTPMSGFDIYPAGGWDLCAQASGLLLDFPPSTVGVVDEELVLEWDHVPHELSQYLLLDFETREYLAVNSLSLTVDFDQGVPRSFRVDLSSGESWENSFTNYELIGDNYLVLMDRLRAKILVPEHIRCFCDGPIYEVQLELPGR